MGPPEVRESARSELITNREREKMQRCREGVGEEEAENLGDEGGELLRSSPGEDDDLEIHGTESPSGEAPGAGDGGDGRSGNGGFVY